MRQDVEFVSNGTRCAGWLFEGDNDDLAGRAGKPCVVMAHGFGATKDAGLLPFAERFAAAGVTVLVFDYRGYGTSRGMPKQHVSHWRHRADYRAALRFVRALPGVDRDRVALWGSSYSGGHVLPVAASDGNIAAVISQGAAMDGLVAVLEILRYAGPVQLARLVGHGLRDALGALAGLAPHLIPVVGPPGTVAAITAAGSESGYQNIMGPTFRNEMCARGVLAIALNRPVLAAGKLDCPVFLLVAEEDNICPPSAVRAAARRLGGRAEVHAYPCGHFDIYVGEVFESSVVKQVEFLRKRLAPLAG